MADTKVYPRIQQPPPPAPRRRSRMSRVVRVILTVLLVVALLVIGALWYVSLRIPRVEVASLDPLAVGEARNFLVVGSDSRERLPDDFPNFFGPGSGQRADVIMVLHMVPGRARAQILSLPRDLRVDIPGRGTDKVNAALSYGGPDLLVQTVRANTGLPIHNYLELDFAGFAEIVDALGGVDMFFPYPARDAKSGLAVEAGQVHLSGGMALAYVRSRQYEEMRDGQWVSVESGDLGRIQRQQRLLFSILGETRNPATVARIGPLSSALGANLRADQTFGVRAMLGILWRMPFLDSQEVEAMALPVEGANIDGISYVVAAEPAAQTVTEAFRNGRSMVAAAEGPPDVMVLNGNGVQGAAAGMADRLEAEGIPVVSIGDADRSDYAQTLVVARPEAVERARMVTEAIGLGRVVTGEVPTDADVLVIVGLDAEEG